MTRSTCSAVAELGKRRGSNIAARVCICLTVLLVLAAVSASAQSTAVPPTGTIQVLGISPATPAPSNPPTAPEGGIILYGSTINPNTGRPYRHLWIGDSNFGLCRVDPDLDTAIPAGAPSPLNVTVATCPFKINGLSVTGGPMAFDPTTSNLYLTDEQTNSEGIFRIGFLPSGDGGHGSLDFNNIFAMAGNITGSRFSGGTTGCAFPDDSTETILASDGVTKIAVPMGVPNSLAIGPDGNLYIGFKKQGGILRINNPATANTAGFGTCADFIQLVAQTPGGGGNGLAFIGHDLWGGLEGGPFVVKNADTTCQALPPSVTQTTVQHATCQTLAPTTPALVALTPTAIYSDQTYPYLNGNNLYFGDASDDMWAGNVAADPALDVVVAGVGIPEDPLPVVVVPIYEPAGAFVDGAVINVGVNAISADMTDPANVVAYSGDDPSGAALLAQGRWWQVFQNESAPLTAPPVPTIVRTSAAGSTLTISWSPAQAALPVTSYTVHALTGGIADQIVSAPPAPAVPTIAPNLGVTFPPNFLVLTGLAAGSYSFEVSATNGSGTSALSAPSTALTLPAVHAPGIPTNISATAGDTVAFVSFAPPPNSAAEGITGYLITATPGGATATTTPTATTNISVIGLTDGTTYTFTVHAINAGGKGMESTPSNPVTPVKPPTTVTLALTGPLSVSTVPIMSTFTATFVNTTPNPATNLVLTYTLVTNDGAAVLLGQPGLGTCNTLSTTQVTCPIGTLAPGASANVNFLVQIKTNSISATAVLTGNAIPATGPAVVLNITTPVLNTTTPGAPPQGGVGPTLTVTVSASSAKPQLNTGSGTTHTFVASNTGSILAQALSFTISEPAQLAIGTVTATSSAVGDPVTCLAPKAGTLNNLPVNNIVCTITSLGGNLKNGAKPTTAQTITIQVNVTAPAPKLQNPINLAVSSVVAFDGIDAVSPSANFTQTVK